MPIRDRTFDKSDISRLKKETWVQIKDLIFETDASILEYLSFHYKRWRMTMNSNLKNDFFPKDILKGRNASVLKQQISGSPKNA